MLIRKTNIHNYLVSTAENIVETEENKNICLIKKEHTLFFQCCKKYPMLQKLSIMTSIELILIKKNLDVLKLKIGIKEEQTVTNVYFDHWTRFLTV